jgi:hypothetical protein
VAATGGYVGSTTTDANGIYTLTGVAYNATNITLTPTLAGYSFTPTSLTVTGPVTANVTAQDFTASALTYTISGTITSGGSPVSGCGCGGHRRPHPDRHHGRRRHLHPHGGGLQRHQHHPHPHAGGLFVYPHQPHGDRSGHGQRHGAGLHGLRPDLHHQRHHHIGRHRSGCGCGGHRRPHPDRTTTDADGTYTLTGVAYNATNITLTPTLAGYSFTPTSLTVTGPVTANVTAQNFTASGPNLHHQRHRHIGRHRSGGCGCGGHRRLRPDVTTDADGTYTLTGVAYNATNITLTPTLAGYSFTPTSLTVTGPVTANVTAQDFTATGAGEINGVAIADNATVTFTEDPVTLPPLPRP